MAFMQPAMQQMLGQGPPPPQEEGALGNRTAPPVRAIDKILMAQHENKQALSFPMGIPQNEQPPQMKMNSAAPASSSFMNAVLGQQNGPTR